MRLLNSKYLWLICAVNLFSLCSRGLCSAESVVLQWNKSSGATGYIVFWGEQPVLPPSTPASQKDVSGLLQDNGSSYVKCTLTDATLVSGRTCYFAVKAFNAAGQSGFSNEVPHLITVITTSSSTSTLTSTTTTAPGAASTSTIAAASTTAPPAVSTTTTSVAPGGGGGGGGGSGGGGGGGGGTAATTTVAQSITTTTPAATTNVTTSTVSQTDTDGDGITDEQETAYGLNPEVSDSDGDGLDDAEELGYWGGNWNADADNDGLINLLDPDSDNDGFRDGFELAQKTNPADGDSFPQVKQSLIAGLGAGASGEGSAEVFMENYKPSLELSINWPEYNILNGEARIATGDIDGDKKKELIVGLGPVEGDPAIPAGKFQILDDNYKLLSWGQIEWPDYNSANGETWPACGDIDGDGKDEILIGLGVGGNGRLEVFDFIDGKAVHKDWVETGWGEYREAGGGVRPACGNLDFDRKDEIVLGLYPVSSLFMPGGRFEILNDTYAHYGWGEIDWPEYATLSGESWPACGDTDRNARDEIILGLGRGGEGKIEVLSFVMGNTVHQKWLAAGSQEYRSDVGETRIACGDIDLDYKDEILVGFGMEGSGSMELLDDAFSGYESLARMAVTNKEYIQDNGQTYPAIQDAPNDIPWLLEVLFKSVAGKMLR